MRNKFLLFCLGVLVLTALFAANSCKKTSTDYLPTLLTNRQWQLASVLVYNYTGSTQTSVDTLNTNCNYTQIFKFNADHTCGYSNFDCLPDSVTGRWAFIGNNLYLSCDMTCKDTTAAGSSKPFQNARIQNLGQYSLVLQTGDLQTYYSPTQPRRIVQYGFIRVKTQ
jgi:hypothetical protein